MENAHVLVIDDEESVRRSIERALGREGHDVTVVASAEEGLERLAEELYDVVLCDIRLDGMDGLAFQERVHVEYPDLPVIMITAYAEVETAVRALKQGAYDYLSKPFSAVEIRKAVWRAFEARRLRLENAGLLRAAEGQVPGVCTGLSGPVKRMYAEALRVAPSNAAVFVSGESGSGKEVLAQYIHANSLRSEHVFLPVNCASLPENLADAHLFGHTRGAFTGATSERRGFLELAHRGTLFLDEIEDLQLDVQAKLLRVLEDGRVRRLGAEREIRVDVRFLAAAQKPPEQLVREGRLRQDLYFRLGAIHLEVPPLRKCKGDVARLALHFLAGFAEEMKKPIEGLDPAAAELLEEYDWPGNVRELRNVMEHAAIYVQPGARVTLAELPKRMRTPLGATLFTIPGPEPPTLAEVSRRYTRFVLGRCKGNQAKAARTLGISPSTLWRHRRELAMVEPDEAPIVKSN
jgi:DNA-binding NtrC family response regulator